LKTLRLTEYQYNYFGEKINDMMPLRQSRPSHHKESGGKMKLGNERDEYLGQESMKSVSKAIVFHDTGAKMRRAASQGGSSFIKVEEVQNHHHQNHRQNHHQSHHNRRENNEEIKGILRHNKTKITSTHEFIDIGSLDNSIIIEEAAEEGSPFSSGRLQSTSTRRVRVQDVNRLTFNRNSNVYGTRKSTTPDKVPLLKLSQLKNVNSKQQQESTFRSIDSYSPSPPRVQVVMPTKHASPKKAQVTILEQRVTSSYQKNQPLTSSYKKSHIHHREQNSSYKKNLHHQNSYKKLQYQNSSSKVYHRRVTHSPEKLSPRPLAVRKAVVTFQKENRSPMNRTYTVTESKKISQNFS